MFRWGHMASNLTMGLFLLKNWRISMFRGLLPRNYLLCQHVVIFEKKNIKKSSSQKTQGDEAENWHTSEPLSILIKLGTDINI